MGITKLDKPLLSISFLSSGRTKTLWKCLESLKPIQNEISTELIIVDTGCDEETYQKMLQYTNKIIKFTWCNDFSKARNVGLKEAKGEWFLFLDDDEWFTDVEELVAFFVSGEYKKYARANYIQRNYTDNTGKNYRDSWVSRIIKLEKDTQFISSIHEYLYPIRGKCKLLHCPVDHYGYVYESKQEKYAHSKRNITLLHDKIQEEKDNPRWWIQLVQEYMGLQEYLKVEELCHSGLKYFKRINNLSVNRSRGTLYAGLIIVEFKRKDYKKAKELYKMALGDQRNTKTFLGRLFSLGAELYYHLEEFEECEKCCREYIKIYEELHDKEYEIMVQGSFFVNHFCDDDIRNNVYGFFIASTLKRKETLVLKEYFPKFEWSKPHIAMYSTTPNDIIEGIASVEFENDFVQIVEVMLERKGVESKVIESIQKIKNNNNYPDTYFNNLCRIVSEVNSKHYYILNMKIIYFNNMNNYDKLNEIYKVLLPKVINIWELDNEIFDIAIKKKIVLDDIIHNIKFENWKKGVDMFFKNARQDKISLRKEFLEKLMDPSDLRYEYFFMKEREASLRILAKEKQKAKDIHNENVEDINIVNHTEIITDNNMDNNTECTPENPLENYDLLYMQLKDYTDRYLTFYGKFFKDIAFEGEMELLPSDCRLAAKLKKVFEEEREGNIRAMTEALQGCFGVHSALDPVLKDFAKGKKEEVKEAVENRKELLSLGEQIKAQVFVLMENGMYAQAKEVLNQLKALLPQDPDLTELEERIRRELS